MIEDAPALSIQRRDPKTPLLGPHGKRLGTLGDFWAWAYADDSPEAEPRILPGYFVELALRPSSPFERGADAGTLDRLTVEVRGASEVPTLARTGPASITFSIANRQDVDVHVFALVAHTDKETLNPLDATQWAFFVVPSVYLDLAHARSRSVSLIEIASSAFGTPYAWEQLPQALREAFHDSSNTGSDGAWSVA